MRSDGNPQFGVMFRCKTPPEALREFVQATEAAGYDEVWVVEDCFFGGGIASAATALAATESIRVGLGILPSVARNPAFTAMEIATLARLHPGRFLPGIGHGVGAWMKQIGAFPTSQLAALEEVTVAVRALLRGETVSVEGKHVHLDGVRLDFPPEIVPPVQLGVRGPKSLALSGRSSDGTILAEFSAPAYIAQARETIAAGQAVAGRSGEDHRLTIYVPVSISDDGQAARDALRPFMALSLSYLRFESQLEPLGIIPEINALLEAGGGEKLEAEMPDAWIDLFAAAGTPEQCAAGIQRFVETGADSIVFVPEGDDLTVMQRVADEVLPLVR